MTSEPELILLTREQVRQVDRHAVDDYGIPGIVLMENAGRNAARIIRERFESMKSSPTGAGFVAIVCGRGNNGGDGFVIARHLANAGIPVELFLACDPDRLSGDAAVNCNIAAKIGLPSHRFDTPAHIATAGPRLGEAVIVVDALLGTGFVGMVRAPLDLAIDAINQPIHSSSARQVVAIDVPSGLDCDTGRPSNATVRADETITFAAMKVGFQQPSASNYTGKVYVADIGAPPAIIQAILGGRA